MSTLQTNDCEHSELTCGYAIRALSESEVAAAEQHIASCRECRNELESLRPLLDQFVSWPTDILRPGGSLEDRLAQRVAASPERGMRLAALRQPQLDWKQVAPGIECILLGSDTENERVSMLVRLAPGANYPPHTHGGTEELHLLHGELWIDDRKLLPGDYNCGAPGASDEWVWSEHGCTCLLITSTKDILR